MFETEYEKYYRMQSDPGDNQLILVFIIIPIFILLALNKILPPPNLNPYQKVMAEIYITPTNDKIAIYEVKGKTYKELAPPYLPEGKMPIYYDIRDPKQIMGGNMEGYEDKGLKFYKVILPNVVLYIVMLTVECVFYFKHKRKKELKEKFEQQRVEEILNRHFQKDGFINKPQENDINDYTIIDKRK